VKETKERERNRQMGGEQIKIRQMERRIWRAVGKERK
jgi:hypothetical protein